VIISQIYFSLETKIHLSIIIFQNNKQLSEKELAVKNHQIKMIAPFCFHLIPLKI